MNEELDWLANSVRQVPHKPFLITPDETVTFSEMEDAVRRAVGALKTRGVERCDTVAIWGENDRATVAAFCATSRCGAVVMPLNTRLSPEEIEPQLKAAGVSLVVAGDGYPDLGVPTIQMRHLDFGTPDPQIVHAPHDSCVIVYTSGTTGESKGVRLTRPNLEASAAASQQHLGHGPDDRWMAMLPLFHVGGMGIIIRSLREGTTVLLEADFDPARAAELLIDGKATLGSLVPTMLDRMLEEEPGPYRGVRAVLLGGGPATQELLERAAAAGLPVLPTYGMTETGSQVATLPIGEAMSPERRVMPVPTAEFRIVSASGQRVSVGKTGHIEVRGPMVSPGYVGEPVHRRSAWFRSGDLGFIDADGYLTVLGRSDEMIISGGENVHPAEIEAVLATHPAVEDAAVVGLPDKEWGELVAAAVVVADSNPVDLEFHVREHLAGFKVPRRWWFVDSLPRNALGKVDRLEVVEAFPPASN